ncbi:hypothetical protein HDU92_007023 [Lobulomyces angularis]|nr:hypothetical protein HDU92_007023 [Lobulomyces angularis]
MHLAFSFATSAMIMLEYIRYFRVWPIGDYLQKFLILFVDSKDSGPAILSHIYLIIGCALPVWISRFRGISFSVSGLCGIITLGVGDSMASVFGQKFGRYKWPNSNKTIEGSVAFVLSVFFIYTIILIKAVPDFNYLEVVKIFVISVITALLEGISNQNDNVILPLFMMSLVNMLNYENSHHFSSTI